MCIYIYVCVKIYVYIYVYMHISKICLSERKIPIRRIAGLKNTCMYNVIRSIPVKLGGTPKSVALCWGHVGVESFVHHMWPCFTSRRLVRPTVLAVILAMSHLWRITVLDQSPHLAEKHPAGLSSWLTHGCPTMLWAVIAGTPWYRSSLPKGCPLKH